MRITRLTAYGGWAQRSAHARRASVSAGRRVKQKDRGHRYPCKQITRKKEAPSVAALHTGTENTGQYVYAPHGLKCGVRPIRWLVPREGRLISRMPASWRPLTSATGSSRGQFTSRGSYTNFAARIVQTLIALRVSGGVEPNSSCVGAGAVSEAHQRRLRGASCRLRAVEGDIPRPAEASLREEFGQLERSPLDVISVLVPPPAMHRARRISDLAFRPP